LWLSDILVIDSGRTDGTLELLAAHPNVWVPLTHRLPDQTGSRT